MDLPFGTVTFLFTDIEGSTKLWEDHPEQMGAALAHHDALLREAIEANRGYVFKTMGDAFCAAFHLPADALNAALQAQLVLLKSQSDQKSLDLRVRMALYTGAAEQRDGDYFGQPLNRVARLLSAGHGGQILISSSTRELIRDSLPPSVMLQNVGIHRFRDLARPEQVFQLVHPDLIFEFPALKSLDAVQHNLPLQLTSFIGREQELADVKQLLTETHLLTLTGPGGCGKTRLALQLGGEVLPRYPDGVWLVELAALEDTDLPVQRVAKVLGLREEPGRPLTETLLEHLRHKSLLLILDNCEHLIAAVARLTETLLRACPDLRVLASSREPLGLPGERLYRIPSLSLPGKDVRAARHTPENLLRYGAVRLFVERAKAVIPGFALTAANARSIVQICERLDGIPLALELAAARVKALSAEQIAARLDDRFRLLTGGSRTALPRQQTLRALLDWSYDLLAQPERCLLRRLSRFAGGCTLDAAEQVCASEELPAEAVLDLLSSLVDKSLLLYEETAEHARYRLLESLRQYAAKKLHESGEAEPIARQHQGYYLSLAEAVAGGAEGGYAELVEEQDNLRGALEGLLGAGEVQAGARLGLALQGLWESQGQFGEGREMLQRCLQSLPTNGDLRLLARLTAAVGWFAYQQTDYEAASRLQQQSLALYRSVGEVAGEADALNDLALTAQAQGGGLEARTLMQQALALAEQLADEPKRAGRLSNLGWMAIQMQNYAEARQRLEEAGAIYQRLHDEYGWAACLCNLTDLALKQQQWEAARGLAVEGLGLFRSLQERPGMAICLTNLGEAAYHLGDLGGSAMWTQEALGISAEAQMSWLLPPLLDLLARIQAAQGEAQEGLFYLLVSQRLRTDLGIIRSLEAEQEMATAEAQFTRIIDKGTVRTLRAHIADLSQDDLITELLYHSRT